MLNLYGRLTAMAAALLLTGGNAWQPACALSTSANPALSDQSVAMLTAKSGQVWKQDYVDWQKEVWGRSQQANINDKLHEGMRLGTGNNSWAEVSWPNVKTRVWSNSQFAVAPNKRLVYLTQGELLFRLDKHRKDKDQPYYIWTKVLQARIRGTTVLVQTEGSVTRFTVMEGVVDITNRLDHSRVTVKPGVVYEIVGYPQAKSSATQETAPAVIEAPKRIDRSVTDILYDKAESCKLPIFQDRCSSSNVYPANSEALKNHPLLQCGGLIDSMSLIQREQKELPGCGLGVAKVADEARLNRVIDSALDVKAVPSAADYFIGQQVGRNIRLPQAAAADFPPRGVIIDARQEHPLAQAKAPLMAPPPIIFHEQDTEAAEAQSPLDLDVSMQLEPLPVQEFSVASAEAGSISSQAGVVSSPFVNTGAVGAATGSAGSAGTLAGVVNTIGPVGSLSAGAVTSVGHLTGPIVSPVGSPVVNGLTGALLGRGSLTNSLNSLTTGLGVR